jgi:hypothetical protein
LLIAGATFIGIVVAELAILVVTPTFKVVGVEDDAGVVYP